MPSYPYFQGYNYFILDLSYPVFLYFLCPFVPFVAAFLYSSV